MAESSTLELLARRLNYAGLALLGGAALAFIWAVGFTRGVDGLIEGLVVSAIGLFLPGIATLWVASLIGGAAAVQPRPRRIARAPTRWLAVLMHYLVAVLAVAAAAALRYWLQPYIGERVPFATFFLAIIVATWFGGVGAGALAVAGSAAVAFSAFLRPGADDDSARWIAAALYLTVALAVGGITAALRVSRNAALALRADLDRSEAAQAESDRLLHALANESPSMLWLCTPQGDCAHVNGAWQAFTGQPLDAALGDGWQQGIHPDDADAWRRLFEDALRARRRFTVEYRRKRHDGTYRRVVDDAEPRHFGERGFAGFVGRTTESQRSRELPLPR